MRITNRKQERGAVMALVGMAMVALTGMAAIGVDYARHALTANEAQVVADAAAQAGALALADGEPIEPAGADVAGENVIAGEYVEAAEVNLALGVWDPETRQFAAGGATPNAVQATATKQLTNIFAGLFGDPQSTVQRNAVAAIGPASSGNPTLPIAFSDCEFPPDCQDPSCLPTLQQQPNNDDNSGFTGFKGVGSSNELTSYLPAACGGAGRSGPTLRVGEAISLNNGQVDSFLQALECTVCDLGLDEFVVPIIAHCDQNFTSASPPTTGGSNGTVYGFANITVDSFNYSNGRTGCGGSGGGTPQTVNLSAVIRDEGGHGAGGPCTGCNFGGAGLVL